MTDPASTPSDEVEPEQPAAPHDRRLFNGGVVLLALTLAYYAFNAQVDSSTELFEGLAMIVLAVMPALLWARRATFEFPVFEVFMLTGMQLYALPLLNGQGELETYSESVVEQAGAAVLFSNHRDFHLCRDPRVILASRLFGQTRSFLTISANFSAMV